MQARPGDLLEVCYEGRWVYLVVLTPVVLFGGRIVFAFHGDGRRRALADLGPERDGFNLCVDLRLAQRDGEMARLAKVGDTAPFFRTRWVKATNEYRPGQRAREWFISSIDKPHEDGLRMASLSPEQRKAMDSGCLSFDLLVDKALQGYTPDQNPHL